MPRNSSGTYSLPAGNPVISGTVIESSWANTTMEDIAEALTWSLDRRGFGGMTVPLYFADGTKAAPGASWNNEQSTGFYRAALGDIRVSVIGQDLFRWWQGEAYVWDSDNATWQKVVASNSIDVDSSGNVTFNNNVTVDGNSTFSGNTTINGDLVVDGQNITTIIQGTGALNRPYRYWKMYNMTPTDNFTAIRLAEIALNFSGTDVQTLATLTSSAPVSNLSYLNDGSTTSSLSIPNNSLTDLELYWDFGASAPQALTSVSQFRVSLEGVGGIGLSGYAIAASDDGTAWTNIATFSGLYPPSGAYETPNYLFQASPGAGVLYPNFDDGYGLGFRATVGTGFEFSTLREVHDYLSARPVASPSMTYVEVILEEGWELGSFDQDYYILFGEANYEIYFDNYSGEANLDFGSTSLFVSSRLTVYTSHILCGGLTVDSTRVVFQGVDLTVAGNISLLTPTRLDGVAVVCNSFTAKNLEISGSIAASGSVSVTESLTSNTLNVGAATLSVGRGARVSINVFTSTGAVNVDVGSFVALGTVSGSPIYGITKNVVSTAIATRGAVIYAP